MQKELKKAGRPPFYKDAEALQAAIDKYFLSNPTKSIILNGAVVEVPVLTITGLMLALGFSDRQSFYDYGKREEFSCTIKTAKLRIESDCEAQLKVSPQGQAGIIFILKNLGWNDLQNQEREVEVAPLKIEIVVEDASKSK